MKKSITLLLITILSIFTLSGCGNANISYDGRYWYNDATATSNILEEITYDVKVVNKTPSDSTEVKNSNIALVLDEGTYTTTLVKEGDNYKYTTSLKIKGNYVYGDKSQPVNDDLTSTTIFTVADLKVISSCKKSTSTTTLVSTNDKFTFVNYGYEYFVNYEGENASAKFTATYGDNEPTTLSKTFKDYSDSPYIDNELLLFMPRAFKIKDKESFNLNFSTIDAISQKLTKMSYTTISNQNTAMDVKTFDFYYDNVINEETIINQENKLEAVKVTLAIDDTYKGSPIELYYATNHLQDRHRLVKAYTSLSVDLGYLEYTIKSANTKTNF